jgi:predicted ester cyclase
MLCLQEESPLFVVSSDVFFSVLIYCYNFVTPDIIYHGMAEEVRSLEEFKRGVAKDLSAFPDMKTIILDIFGEENKVAIRWNLKATHEKDFADSPATQKKSQAQGVDIFHFEGDKIKEAWTVTVLAQ